MENTSRVTLDLAKKSMDEWVSRTEKRTKMLPVKAFSVRNETTRLLKDGARPRQVSACWWMTLSESETSE
jgi:hypothetical protein